MKREGNTIYQEQVRQLTADFNGEEKGNFVEHLEFLIRTEVLRPGEKQIIFTGCDSSGYCYIVGEDHFYAHETASKVLKTKGYSFERSFYYGSDQLGYTNIEIWTK